MSTVNQPSAEHQVGVTNAQENNPDPVLADLTRRMNAEFQARRYAEAGAIALEITARNKDELAAVFQQHGVTVLHLNHEAFGIYEGQIEPTYDVHDDAVSRNIPHTHSRATMNVQDHLQRLVDAFNDRAKAEGRYLDKDFWEIPRQPGSFLDVPETPESRERVAWLRQRIAELKQAAEKAPAPVPEVREESGAAGPGQLLEEKAQVG